MLRVAPGTSRLAALPGVRTLAMPRFRVALAGVLLLVAGALLGSLLLARAASPTGQFGIDATDYLTAAARVARGESPYAREMLAGPVDSQGVDRYRYPPPLAQVLVPLTSLPTPTTLWVFLALQAAAIVGALVLAVRGAWPRDVEAVLWSLVAACLFLPLFDSLWKGNVSGFVALLVMLAVRAAGTGGAAVTAATLLKVVPGVFVPAWWMHGSASRRALVGTALAVVGVSVLLSPVAWRDYATVLPNLLAGTADEPTNVAPWSMVARSGAPAALADLVRLGSIAIAALTAAAAVVVMRRPGGPALAAALCSVSMLLLPAALWYHYLAVLLPLAIVAWPLATSNVRTALCAAGLLVSAGVAWLPLATVGWVTMAALIVGTLARPATRPRPAEAAPAAGSA
jgi:hypothetical protein